MLLLPNLYGMSIFWRLFPSVLVPTIANTDCISLLQYDEKYKAYHRPVLKFNVEFAWRPTEAFI